MSASVHPLEVAYAMRDAVLTAPAWLLLTSMGATALGLCILLYTSIHLAAPTPRPPFPSEKTFVHIRPDGSESAAQQLPCWQDRWAAEKESSGSNSAQIAAAEVFISLVIPAYNEEQRLGVMLAEAVDYLDAHYPNAPLPSSPKSASPKQANGSAYASLPPAARPRPGEPSGWEILLVSDGSTDATLATALDFARSRPAPESGGAVRCIALSRNRGKGGAVTHGLRHARGQYCLFADADGATSFADLGRVVEACRAVEDGHGRGVAVGSRAHLVGSEAVVQRSFLRNLLMHCFHLLIKTLTPAATARIGDTQCGFKLFSRQSLPHIVPYMHSEGWIFDVEMLMLAEGAPSVEGAEADGCRGIRVVEVPVGWREVMGSKLNVVWDSLGMAWGLAILRLAWGVGVYKRW